MQQIVLSTSKQNLGERNFSDGVWGRWLGFTFMNKQQIVLSTSDYLKIKDALNFYADNRTWNCTPEDNPTNDAWRTKAGRDQGHTAAEALALLPMVEIK